MSKCLVAIVSYLVTERWRGPAGGAGTRSLGLGDAVCGPLPGEGRGGALTLHP